jgi:hypothetical protein
VVAVVLEIPQVVLVAQVVVEMGSLELQMVKRVIPILVVVVEALVMIPMEHQLLAAQAAPVSSSLNTTHLHNPSLHSRVLASG